MHELNAEFLHLGAHINHIQRCQECISCICGPPWGAACTAFDRPAPMSLWAGWNPPVAPTSAQKELLEASAEVSIERAAAAVGQADVLLLLTGAGWSADSGLAVYRDVANVAAYSERGITYADLCSPALLDDDPELFVGFWGRCFNDYRDTSPHEGYSILRRWRDERFTNTETARRLAAYHSNRDLDQIPSGFFSYTSNVDAHHLRCFPANEVRECHGNSELWQCSDYECAHGRSRGVDRFETSSSSSDRWEAPAGYRFRVDDATQLAPAAGPPQCDGGEATRSTAGLQSFHGKNHPTCPRCKKAARPAILMFGDSAWRDDDKQEKRWERWVASLHHEQDARVAAWSANHAGATKDAENCVVAYASATAYADCTQPLRVAIMEVGAGGNVTTVRNVAERLLQTLGECGADPTLIRINPELPLADSPEQQSAVISIMSRGLAAVRQIDEALRVLCAQGEQGEIRFDAFRTNVRLVPCVLHLTDSANGDA
eukprot:COSAG02_NODE_932_length_15816_cov_15.913088_6_plen_488_part_00